ncbi:protein ELYS [Trichogramma pretiosum]|uniref:protein ELYS n=1 Tax=Trichogramma pretiosum TaxID=7493 RepID=UPI0006C9C83B|nr:protein ELYS [Trichogramma pretiosum]XP_014230992.1 protein ELYS [Trichogramma pretiosum]
MKELEETNCEVRSVVNFDLPQWESSDGPESRDEDVALSQTAGTGITDSSKEAENLTGGFLGNDCKHSWMTRDRHLIVLDNRTGKCICSWVFQYKVTTVSAFPTRDGQVPVLLIGLDNNAVKIKDSVGYLCIFDCCSSNVLTTIEVPAGVEKACVIHGGMAWEDYNERRPNTVLSDNSGLIFTALRNLQHIIIDVNRVLWKDFFLEGKTITARLDFVNTTHNTAKKARKEYTHLAYDLMEKEIEQFMGFDRKDFESTPLYDENLCSVLISSEKTGCLITGCLGRVIIWQSDGSIGWISPLFDENAYVTHIALIEPSDDPRPFYYLWIACQNDSPDSSAVLRMYAMLFSKKQISSSSSSYYYDLESDPSLKFELELDIGERIHTLQPIERECLRDTSDISSIRGEDSLLLIGTDDRVLIFDLNRWYKEQMPRTITECRNPNSVMASYRTKTDDMERKNVFNCAFVPRSLKEFISRGPTSMEELFYPNSLMLEWAEMSNDGVTGWLARGVQTELLRDITIAGPIVLVKPSETYHRCLSAGLIPFDSTLQDHPYRAEAAHQREMLLSLCLEQRRTNFLSNCGREWSDGSASYLYPEFLRWGVQRASEIKMLADHLCIPLFDHSGTTIGEAEAKTLRFCEQQLECLTNVIGSLPRIEKDLEKQRRALKRIATYLQVLMWFYDVNLLPETQYVDEEEEEEGEIAPTNLNIPYPKQKLVEWYKKKRSSYSSGDKKDEDCLFIDHLISHECLPLRLQWERESIEESPNAGSGYYPPPSLQSLLRIFLTDCHREDPASITVTSEDHEQGEQEDEMIIEGDSAEIDSKHSVTIYLLMDLAMLLQGTYPSIDRLIKYPSAFKLSPSLIKLTQAFWLLDHDDFEGFFKIVTGQLISTTDLKEWHHKLAVKTLLKNDQHKLALVYLRILKPPLSSLEDQGTLISLTVGQGLVESAFHSRPPSHYAQLLTCFFQSCQMNGKLKEVLQLALDSEEEEAFIKFLKKTGNEDARLFYYLQRGRHTEASDIYGPNAKYTTNKPIIHPLSMKMLGAFNATLPTTTRQFASTLTRINVNPPKILLDLNNRSYPRPMSQCRDKTREIHEIAFTKTRETCLKSEKLIHGSGHIPFLNAPASTVVFCSRTAVNQNDMSISNKICFASKKGKGKRTLHMLEDEEILESGVSERKKQKLSGKGKPTYDRSRRLSMSQVCDTPLVQRKLAQDVCKTGSLATETPQSILKIRQMLRNSNSPAFGSWNGSGERSMRKTPVSNIRSARQIRFSIDRTHNGNDSSLMDVEDNGVTDYNEDNMGQRPTSVANDSKNTEASGANESYHSLCEGSAILSDNSYTKSFHGPKPRPSYRRSSTASRGSSTYLSQKSSTSVDTTLDGSVFDASLAIKPQSTANLSPRKSIVSGTTYNESILSENTSYVDSSIENYFAPPRRRDEESTASEIDEEEDEEGVDEINTEIIAKITDTGVDFDSSIKPSDVDYELKISSQDEDEEMPDEPMEIQFEDDEAINTSVPQSQENESSGIDASGPSPAKMMKVVTSSPESFKQSQKNQYDTEKELPRKSEESFQSIKEFDYQFSNPTSVIRTDKIRKSMGNQSNISTDGEIENYTLTKPIFLNECGIVKCNEQLTDDESNDDDVDEVNIKVNRNDDDGEESELTLNLSSSDGSGTEKKRLNYILNQRNDEEESGLGKETSSLVERLAKSKDSEHPAEPIADESKKVTLSRHSSVSSLSSKSEDIADEGTPLRRSARRHASTRSQESTPTKSKISNNPTTAKMLSEVTNISPKKQIITDLTEKLTSPVKIVSKAQQSIEVNESPSSTEEVDVSLPVEKITQKRATRASSRKPQESPKIEKAKKPTRKTRATSVVEGGNDEITKEKIVVQDDTTIIDKNQGLKLETSVAPKKKSSRLPKTKKEEQKSDESTLIEDKVETKKSRTRATKLTKDTSSDKKEEKLEESDDEEHEDVLPKTRSTRASHDKDAAAKPSSRKGRTGSVAKEIVEDVQPTRRTRATSVVKDEISEQQSNVITKKRTRAASIAKEVSEDKSKIKKSTRATSLNKEISQINETQKNTRTRGQSLPKDIVQPQEILKLTSRNRRSTSLLKEVILEESISQLNSPVSNKRNRIARLPIEETTSVTSSPAGNTRSRRSSIQSVTEDVDENLAKSTKTNESKEEPRLRRAVSVDSSIVVPTGKRLTRGALAKTSIIEDVIPEETELGKKVVPSRKKRAASVSTDKVTDEIGKAKIIKKQTEVRKTKRGRKNSESKDFEFSLPEHTDGLTNDSDNECRTPKFKFSEPAGFQKFLSPIRDEEDESSEEVTENSALLERDAKSETARTTRAKGRITRAQKTKGHSQ